MNNATLADFVGTVGPLYEHSPWITILAWRVRPFADRASLREVTLRVVQKSSLEQQRALIMAHPGSRTGRSTLTR